MKRWYLQIAAGWALGMAVQAAMPGQQAAGWILASVLSLGGAAGGEAVALCVLPKDLMASGGVLLAAMGAVASLLAEAVFCS